MSTTTPAPGATPATPAISSQRGDVSTFNFFNPDHFATMQRVCTMFASSELVPEMYRMSDKNPKEKAIANCMIAVETASRIGASPLMVMQNMYIVQGKPSWSAKFLTATVNACGRYAPMKYKIRNLGQIKEVEYVEYQWNNEARRKMPVKKVFKGPIDNLECIAYTTERGSAEVLESVAVTIKLAIEEGWYTKDGSKWPTMTQLMLQYRAVTYWTSAYAPELSMGIKTREELEDFEDIPYEDISDKVAADVRGNANREPIGFDHPGTPPAESKPEEKAPESKSETPTQTGPGF
jgi:hypothetical protein